MRLIPVAVQSVSTGRSPSRFKDEVSSLALPSLCRWLLGSPSRLAATRLAVRWESWFGSPDAKLKIT
ncbi:hypothetical protein AAHA92_21887 [Salvia divinorum]|uniref:Uncharacterized protein n=1 Tax=Salvia divinorum TaxID=28513 RepID=A0ABD1GLW7_SALDI